MSPKSCICTLFEGHYESGLGALVNSLYCHSYRGVIWAGYRGRLPAWASPAEERSGYVEFTVAGGCMVRFVPIQTSCHLTNYKPEFLSKVWRELDPDAEYLFYFDPDIVAKTGWNFFEEWAGYGVALVEDVNSPVPESHPRRHAWRRCLQQRGQFPRRETSFYVNGGFLGLNRAHRQFLDDWNKAMDLVGYEIGGLERSMFSFETGSDAKRSPAYPFNKTDQDALNIAVMMTDQPISIMGSEGMDFRSGGWTMSHALGSEKPWLKNFLVAALAGRPPSMADREFWRHVESPIPVFTLFTIGMRRIALRLGCALGRFYRRG